MRKRIKSEDLVLLDLFSGTGGFHSGLEDAGFKFKQVYYSEIDKHAIANYKYNFPHAKYIGAVEKAIGSKIERPNIITFGSPCQDFSIAGKREGLSGTKSSLVEQAIATITHYRPDMFIWENVKGAFTSNNREDFWAIIQAFANIRGYVIEWQLVNTTWILPQNRERIYLVGHLAESFGDWRKIFPVTENDRLSLKKDGKSEGIQTQICGTIMTGYGGRPTDTYVLLKDSILRKGYGPNQVPAGPAIIGSTQKNASVRNDGVCPTLTCAMGEGGGHIPMIVENNPARKGYAQAILTPDRLTKRQNGRRIKDIDEPSFTLTAQDRHGVFDGRRIRRLTEIECERLQGYPDNWTRYGNYDGEIKELSGTQRYKLCGNAVTKLMVQMIGNKALTNF
jgi:DNA (cytosine-5)-methyltransferase 1